MYKSASSIFNDTFGIANSKRINLVLIDEHYSLSKEMIKINKNVSFKERKPIIYDKVTFMAYDGKKVYKMPLEDLYKHYNWETDYIVIIYIRVSKNKEQQSMEQAYDQFIQDANTLIQNW
jgi:hypothetical protein